MNKEKAVESNFYTGTLMEAIQKLERAEQLGRNEYIDFNGTKIYSADMTNDHNENINKTYLTVCGKTYDQVQDDNKRWQEEREKEEKLWKEKEPEVIKQYIEKGKPYIKHGLEQDWAECVKIRVEDIYRGAEIKNAIDVMKLINESKIGEAINEIYNANHSG